jgi:hypothetical protein
VAIDGGYTRRIAGHTLSVTIHPLGWWLVWIENPDGSSCGTSRQMLEDAQCEAERWTLAMMADSVDE